MAQKKKRKERVEELSAEELFELVKDLRPKGFFHQLGNFLLGAAVMIGISAFMIGLLFSALVFAKWAVMAFLPL